MSTAICVVLTILATVFALTMAAGIMVNWSERKYGGYYGQDRE